MSNKIQNTHGGQGSYFYRNGLTIVFMIWYSSTFNTEKSEMFYLKNSFLIKSKIFCFFRHIILSI